MKSSTMRPLLAAFAVFAVLAGCSGAAGDTTTIPAAPNTTDDVPPPIADGTWFAFVTVGEDETGEMTLGVDLAEMLSGDEAVQAAVEDGVIGEGEELPNDFYIDNDDVVMELLHATDDARFMMISGEDIEQKVEVDASILARLYEGTYTGDPIYGVAAGVPIAMDVEVSGGQVAGATAVYLP